VCLCVFQNKWAGVTNLESSWNVMAHGDAREGKWRGNWRMEWIASTLHTTSEHGVSSITTADAHTSAASSQLNWSPRRFKRTRPFRRKTKSGFCACAITFQMQSTTISNYFLTQCCTVLSKTWEFFSKLRNPPHFNVPESSIFLLSLKRLWSWGTVFWRRR